MKWYEGIKYLEFDIEIDSVKIVSVLHSKEVMNDLD